MKIKSLMAKEGALSQEGDLVLTVKQNQLNSDKCSYKCFSVFSTLQFNSTEFL